MRRATHLVSAKATVTYTSSGFTSLRAARERPEAPILGVTPSEATARRLALVWGVHSVLAGGEARDEQSITRFACRAAVAENFAMPGENIVITAGVPFGTSGTTNLLRIVTVPKEQ